MTPDASGTEALDQAVRLHVFRATANTGKVPAVAEVVQALRLTPADAAAALGRLAAGRVLVLAPGTTNIWMANPFSAVPTPFRVRAQSRTYFGNCVWDALGIPAILSADARIETQCGDCGSAMVLEVRRGELILSEGIIHFAVPAARWWDNIGYT